MSIFTKPTELPRWADTGSAPAGNITDPPSGNKDMGWVADEVPPSSWFNWWQQLVYKWTQWLDSQPLASMAAVLTAPSTGGTIASFTVSPQGLIASPVMDLTNVSLMRIIAVGLDAIVDGTTRLYTSDNGGLSWDSRNDSSGTKQLRAVCQKVGDLTGGTNLFVAVGDAGKIITSTSGISWTLRTSGTSEDLQSVIWTGTQFVASGTNNKVLTSPTGTTWTARTTGMSATGTVYVTSSGSVILAVSDTGSTATCMATSADGITWTLRTAPATHLGVPYYMGFGTPIFVVTTITALYTSPDGITWTSRATPGTGSKLDFILTEGGVGVGYLDLNTGTASTDTIVTSLDGITWTVRQYLGPSIYAACASHGGFLTMTSDPLGTASSKSSLGPCFL